MADELLIYDDIVFTYDDEIIVEPPALTLKGIGDSFPPQTINISSFGVTFIGWQFHFSQPFRFTVKYGEDLPEQVFIPKYNASTGTYWLVMTANYYWSNQGLDYIIPIHDYSDGDNSVLRTVEIKFTAPVLKRIVSQGSSIAYAQPFAFDLRNMPQIENFAPEGIVTEIPGLENVSSETNPFLTSVNNNFWHPTSPWRVAINPYELQWRLQTFVCGNSDWNTVTDIEQTNLHLFAASPMGQFLKAFVLGGQLRVDLPNNFILPLAYDVRISMGTTNYPSIIGQFPSLLYITIQNQATFTSWGTTTFINIANITTYNNASSNAYMYGLPPNIASSTAFRNVQYTDVAINTNAKLETLVMELYNLVYNASSQNSGDNRFYDMNIFLNVGSTYGGVTPFSEDPETAVPLGFSLGVTDGTVDNAAKAVYCLVNNHGASVYYSGW